MPLGKGAHLADERGKRGPWSCGRHRRLAACGKSTLATPPAARRLNAPARPTIASRGSVLSKAELHFDLLASLKPRDSSSAFACVSPHNFRAAPPALSSRLLLSFILLSSPGIRAVCARSRRRENVVLCARGERNPQHVAGVVNQPRGSYWLCFRAFARRLESAVRRGVRSVQRRRPPC